MLAEVDGKLLPIPVNLDTVNRLYGFDLDEEGLRACLERVREPRKPVKTSEDVVVAAVGRDLYERFLRGHTRKQWGMDPSVLDVRVTARIPVRWMPVSMSGSESCPTGNEISARFTWPKSVARMERIIAGQDG